MVWFRIRCGPFSHFPRRTVPKPGNDGACYPSVRPTSPSDNPDTGLRPRREIVQER